jgi:oligopeptide transport system ATP-binding protein
VTAGDPLLSVEELVVRFRTHEGTIHAVNGVSFQLEEGERLGLVGESGCGKSVTNLAMIRLLPQPAGRIEGGHVMFDAQDLTKLREDELRSIRGRDIAMIFQDPMTSLNPVLTVEEQMIETIMAHREITRDKARARAVELLKMVGIPQPETRLKSFPHQFSGGMRQRVMIAMALALEPKLMIADEPTTALDVTIQAQVLELLRGLTEESGSALILISHDLGVVAGMTNRINVMYAGYIVESATTLDLFAVPSHPYTIGLLHSIPRVDAVVGEPLIPIEGRPPDMRRAPTNCPFAARCRWRLDVCWQENPGLTPTIEGTRVVLTGPGATHQIACFNPPTVEEAVAGRPLRPGFSAAPPPAGAIDEVGAGRLDSTDDLEGMVGAIEAEEGPISLAPSAGGLPVPPESEHPGEGVFRDD